MLIFFHHKNYFFYVAMSMHLYCKSLLIKATTYIVNSDNLKVKANRNKTQTFKLIKVAHFLYVYIYQKVYI